MSGPLTDSRLEQAIHVMFPAALAALMLAIERARAADPDIEVEVRLADDAPAIKLRAGDLFPVLRLEMDRRQAKSAARQGGGT